MSVQMLVVDMAKYTIEERMFAEPLEVKEGMFLEAKDNPNPEHNGMTPAAYVFPLDKHDELRDILNQLKFRQKEFEDFRSYVYYQLLPKLRTWDRR